MSLQNDTQPIVTSSRRSQVKQAPYHESGEVRMQTLLRRAFMALYVVSATFSQLTVCILLNYLVQGASG